MIHTRYSCFGFRMKLQKERLKWARVSAGFSGPMAVQRQTGIKADTFKAHESGRNQFDFEQARSYGKAFGVEAVWLLTGEGPVWAGPPELMDPVRNLIARLSKETGKNFAYLSKKAGKNHAYIHQFITRKSPLTLPEDVRMVIASELGVPEKALKPSLVAGFDPEEPEPIQAEDPTTVGFAVTTNEKIAPTLPPGTLVEHAIYGGAGGGGEAMEVMIGGERGEAASGLWTFPPAFLKNELHLNLSSSDIVRVRGDSMEPTLWDGDRVIVDRSDVNVRVDGIFAISDEGSLIIKQVEIVRGTNPVEILCTSRNPAYSAFQLKLGGNTRVLGRVVARIGRV